MDAVQGSFLRALGEPTGPGLRRTEKARAKTGRHVWAQRERLPAFKFADTDLGDLVVLDVDATLVTAHSEEEQAAPTFKAGFEYHPIGVVRQHHGAARHLSAARQRRREHCDQPYRRAGPSDHPIPAPDLRRLLVRADGAGASHDLLGWLTQQDTPRRSVEYSVGFSVTDKGPHRDHEDPETSVDPGIRR
jgi:hypothetical protein